MDEMLNIIYRHAVRNDYRRPAADPRRRMYYARDGWSPGESSDDYGDGSSPGGGLGGGLGGSVSDGTNNRIISVRGVAFAAGGGERVVKSISNVIPFNARIKEIRIAYDYNDAWEDGVRVFAMRDESVPMDIIPVTGRELSDCVAAGTGVTMDAAIGSRLLTDPQGLGRFNLSCDIPIRWDRWRLYLYYYIKSSSAGVHYNATVQIAVEEEVQAAIGAARRTISGAALTGAPKAVAGVATVTTTPTAGAPQKPTSPQSPTSSYTGEHVLYRLYGLHQTPSGYPVGVSVWRRADLGPPAPIKGGEWVDAGKTRSIFYTPQQLPGLETISA